MSLDSPSAVLAVRDLRVSFAAGAAASAAVAGVSFTVNRGEVLALVGESGSGKSVTAMAILGLLPGAARVSGEWNVAGHPGHGTSTETFRSLRGRVVGTVFQEPMSAFNPVYTLGEQIAETLRVHRVTRGWSATRQRVLELFARVGLPDPQRVARSYPHELSGGQLQRAMIAMAISCNPQLLIADEPTTALDVTVQAEILDLLRTLRDEQQLGILLITHDMGVVADLADSVAVMRHGQIVEQADVRSVLADPQHDYTVGLLAAVPKLRELSVEARVPAGRPEAVAVPGDVDRLGDAVVRVDRASVVYGARRVRLRGARAATSALREVSVSLHRGRVLGLVGESGSGKSTLGRAIAGLVPLRSGSITVDAVQLSSASRAGLRRLRSRIGFVFQDPASSLNPRFTIARCVSEPLELHAGLGAQQRRDRVVELLEAVRLGAGFVDRFPHELSGGQRQRVAIARALALRPSVLIADEATSALDVSVQASVLELLVELQEQYSFACLFISHNLAVVQQLAHEVAVMRDGEVLEYGPAASVLRSPEHDYTKRLLAAAPVADRDEQERRRRLRRELAAAVVSR